MTGRRRDPALLLTCEHGGNAVPLAYRALFRGKERQLAMHHGYDIGARIAARYLGRALGAPLVCATVTRLLVDLNRSVGRPGLFSEYTRGLAAEEREILLDRYYHPYRDLVSGWVAGRIRRGATVLHLAVHSFTPVLNGVRRQADVAFLDDPQRRQEVRRSRAWQDELRACGHGWRVRRNYPYRGVSDGQIPALRRRFPASHYVGIEIEINQALLIDPTVRVMLLRDLALILGARL